MHSGMANGNIKPQRFVRQDTSADNKFVQSSTGERCFGVSREGSRYPPGYGSLDDGYIAIAGENIAMYTEKDICLLKAGGTWAAGDRLKSDSDGAGVVTTTEGDEIGAIALQAASSGDLGKVYVITDREKGA